MPILIVVFSFFKISYIQVFRNKISKDFLEVSCKVNVLKILKTLILNITKALKLKIVKA